MKYVMIGLRSLSFFWVLNLLVLSASAIESETSGSARLKFVNLDKKSEAAPVYITIFRNQREWDNEQGTEMAAVRADQREVLIENLLPQPHGFGAFIDLNGNGKLDSNALGVPKEPWALSKMGSKLPFGRPSWSSIAVDIKQGRTEEVSLYFHH